MHINVIIMGIIIIVNTTLYTDVLLYDLSRL